MNLPRVSLEQESKRGSQHGEPQVRLRLLGGFELRQGSRRIELPAMAQKLVAFAAIHRSPLARQFVAGNLWPHLDDLRAAANLRSLLWRLRKRCRLLLASSQLEISMGDVDIDLPVVHAAATRMLDVRPSDAGTGLPLQRLQEELLPDWYDDWIIVERERLRQTCLHALEAAAGALSAAGKHGAAVEAAMMAIKIEPYRESAHRVLITLHLAEGNHYEAARQFFLYSDLVRRELDASPSSQMLALATRIGRTGISHADTGVTGPDLPFLRWRNTVARGSGS